MAHTFFGNLVAGRTRQKVRAVWTGIFKRKNRWLMETKIETVTVEKKRGQLATAEGTFNLVHKVFPIKVRCYIRRIKREIGRLKLLITVTTASLKGSNYLVDLDKSTIIKFT